MVNHVANLLYGKRRSSSDMWYIPPEYTGLRAPDELLPFITVVTGTSAVEEAIMDACRILEHPDMVKYSDLLDTRRTIKPRESGSVYAMYDNSTLSGDDNRLDAFISYRRDCSRLFRHVSDPILDSALQELRNIFYSSDEYILKYCAFVLALAYQLNGELK